MSATDTPQSTPPISERTGRPDLTKYSKTPRLEPPPQGFSDSVKKRLGEIEKATPKFHPLFFRVYAGQTGLTDAVKAKCLDCSCWQIPEITHCTVFTCSLWAFRPYQKKAET